MHFKIVGRIEDVEVIASGKAIRERKRLWKRYGKGRWRKLKASLKFSLLMVRFAGRKFTGTKLMGSARRNTKSSGLSSNPKAGFGLCVRNTGYPASLELRKVYRLLSDEQAAKRGQVRVVDESGEDYLYSEAYFVPIKLPQSAERAVLKAIYPLFDRTGDAGLHNFVRLAPVFYRACVA
jgi:hypothetical protein